jgi:histidyl-tRNA synthetase
VSDNTKFGPPKGMRDWLPQETLLRQKLIRLIEFHYQLYSFQPIDTPVMENIEVLHGKGGGENEKLMFKVVKRGEDFIRVLNNFEDEILKSVVAKEEMRGEVSSVIGLSQAKTVSDIGWQKYNNDLADMGLRFDLTVPLARYYANHSNELPKPFRCYHIGPVWRADRPQKGRYREFYQCDIDIIGGAVLSAEVELLLATDRVLKALNIGKFKIRVSHKNLIPKALKVFGVKESVVPKVAMAIDKLDKQPWATIKNELETLDMDRGTFLILSRFIETALANRESWFSDEKMKSSPEVGEIELVCKSVKAVNPAANVVFDPLLVRGFDYYTGPVFEINVEDKDFTFSIGGGGRYDGLIEKLGGPKNTPAVGISLGFERILLILNEKQKSGTQAHVSRVFIVNNGQSEKDIQTLAEELRSEGIQVETSLENKKIGQQLEAAQKNGIEYAITEFQPGHKSYKVRQLSTRQDKEMTLAELYDIMKRLSEGVED